MEEHGYLKEKEVDYILDIPEILSKKKQINKEICEADFYRMSDMADVQLLVPFFYKTYFDYLPKEIKDDYDKRFHDVDIKLKKMLEMLKIIKCKFDKNNIPFWLIKGFAFSNYIFNDYMIRDFNDLDILVDYDNMQRAAEILFEMGFTSNLDNNIIPDLKTIECYEVTYYKLFTEGDSLSEKRKCKVELKVSTSSTRDMNLINKYKKNSVEMCIDETKINTFSLNDTFILLCANMYGNFELEFAKARMRDLFDIYFFFERYEKQLDWSYISKLCNEFKISHKLYAIFNFVNSVYKYRIPEKIVNMFSVNKRNYDTSIYHNFEHNFMRDWSIDFIDIMLSRRDVRRVEMYYQNCVKAYSSRNKYYNEKIYIESLNDVNGDFKKSIRLKGFKSDANELEYSYRFNHDDENIYFTLHFEQFNHENNMRTVLIIFDVDRKSPRKIIEFSWESGRLICKSLLDDFEVEQVKANENEILVSMCKNQINVLQNEGRVLGYYMYSVRRYNQVDYAMIDELSTFDYENHRLIYFNANLKKYLR